MVAIRKLNDNEAAVAFPKRGHIDLSDYTNTLQSLTVGDTAEVELNGITRRALKRRMGMAARQMGATLKWSRLSNQGQTMIFQLRNVATKARRSKRVSAAAK